MNKFKYYFILIVTGISLFSCSKSDSPNVEPIRDYTVQYNTDIADIEEYLNTNYITVVNHAGFQDDQDVTIQKITDAATQPSIMSYLNSATYPSLKSKNVDLNGIVYKLYYLVLRPGVGGSPTNVDGVLASYNGQYVYRVAATATVPTYLATSQFEKVSYPQSLTDLYSVIKGWSEIFPEFKTGTYQGQNDGTISYNDFGAGVMFIPSGLGYYATGSGSIPSYVPLVFSFKLYELQRLDHDSDGILDMLEDINKDGYVRDMRSTVLYPNAPVNPDDTDGDGIPDFLDVDDDGDAFSTRLEIKNPATGLPYPFDQIPSCTSGKKNYLDPACH